MNKTAIIEDPNFYQRLIDLKIITPNKDREIKISQLKKVKELDLSNTKIYSVKELVYFERLQKLNLSNGILETLDLSKNLELRIVQVSGNKLRLLNIENLKKLHCLHVDGALEQLIFPDKSELFELALSCKKLKTLDLHSCKKLKILNISGSKLTHLDLSAQSLIYLNLKGNRLKSLDLSKQVELEYVNAIDNQINDCVFLPNSSLRFVLLGGNPIKTEDLQHDPAFSNVHFSESSGSSIFRNYESYFLITIRRTLDELKRKCVEDGTHPNICADLEFYNLCELLRKYDRKRRFYRYEQGLIILTHMIINYLRFLHRYDSPQFSAENFTYSDAERTYYQEASSLDLDDFPLGVELKIAGRIIEFDVEEIAFTSDGGIPNDIAFVRYTEIIVGKVRAFRSIVIWND
jgi:uncharacterized protein YjbI with pentapeptide repeats